MLRRSFPLFLLEPLDELVVADVLDYFEHNVGQHAGEYDQKNQQPRGRLGKDIEINPIQALIVRQRGQKRWP